MGIVFLHLKCVMLQVQKADPWKQQTQMAVWYKTRQIRKDMKQIRVNTRGELIATLYIKKEKT